MSAMPAPRAQSSVARSVPVAAAGPLIEPDRVDRKLLHQRPPPPPVAVIPPASAAVAAPPPRAPSIVIGSTQQVLINNDRAAAGRGPLSWSSCLYSVALANAKRMAAQGFISHTNGPNADLGCGVGSRAGENVGYWTGGVNDAQLNTMFMNSPDHRANIMGPYRYVGTAWVTAPNGVAYIAVELS
jgi:uncharacterized protein YkwD